MTITTATYSPTVSKLRNRQGFASVGQIASADYQFCRWENVENAAVDVNFFAPNPNTIYKDGGTPQLYDGGATSIQQVTQGGSNPQPTARLTLVNDTHVSWGLSSVVWDTNINTRSRIEYAAELDPRFNQLLFYEQGVLKGAVTTFQTGQLATAQIDVVDTGTDMQCLVDGVSVFTYPGTTAPYSAGRTYYYGVALIRPGRRIVDCQLFGAYV